MPNNSFCRLGLNELVCGLELYFFSSRQGRANQMEEMQKKLEEAEQRVQSLEEEKDKKREKKKKKLSVKEEFEEEEIPEDLWERQEYYQVRAKSRVLSYEQREAAFKEARLLAGLAEIDEGLQGLVINYQFVGKSSCELY